MQMIAGMLNEKTIPCTIFSFGSGVVIPDCIDPDAYVDPSEFEATSECPGSYAKIEIMRRRVERGHPVFHPNDRPNFAGVNLIKDQVKTVRVPAPPRNRKPKSKENNP